MLWCIASRSYSRILVVTGTDIAELWGSPVLTVNHILDFLAGPQSSKRGLSATDGKVEVDMDDCKAMSDTNNQECTQSGTPLDRQLAMKKPPPPPFLSYKSPRGERGWAIIALLIGVGAPSLAVLITIVRGITQNRPDLYFVAEPDSCSDLCFMRYRQMLFMMCCLGFLTSYYAFTIGFMGSGPTTWLYKNVYLRWFRSTS